MTSHSGTGFKLRAFTTANRKAVNELELEIKSEETFTNHSNSGYEFPAGINGL